MKALHWMDRYRKEVLQLSTRKHGINVQYLYDKINFIRLMLCLALMIMIYYEKPLCTCEFYLVWYKQLKRLLICYTCTRENIKTEFGQIRSIKLIFALFSEQCILHFIYPKFPSLRKKK